MWAKLRTKLQVALIGAGFCLFLGFGIESSVSMPDYAVVFVDDIAKTYIALPCVEEWRNTQTKTVDVLRRTTSGEAHQLTYRPDAKCIESGAIHDDDRSLTGLLLVKLGILPPAQHWWDQPYRTEDGIVYPKP